METYAATLLTVFAFFAASVSASTPEKPAHLRGPDSSAESVR